jgi:hypothetical protein
MMLMLRALTIVVMLLTLSVGGALAQTDAETVKAALDKAFLKYDHQISVVLDRGQDQAFNVVNEDTHGVYFSSHPITRAEVNGYQAFLQQKLKLTPQQQEKLYWIERRMYSECEPLWKKYRALKGGG